MNDINEPEATNADQIRYWNSVMGEKWVKFQKDLDACFSDINTRLFECAKAQAGEKVLDIGCGAGETTLELADQIGPTGRITGVDISQVLLDYAIERAKTEQKEGVQFVLADAQVHAFPRATFDLLLSRFGVMFFNDPFAAFSNMADALRPGGRMVFVAWSEVTKNPWFEIPKQAAIQQLGKPEPVSPRAPGPMAFAEPGYVNDILSKAGLKDIEIREQVVMLTPDGTLDDVANLACNLGPATRLLKEKNGSEEDFLQIKNKVTGEFENYLDGSVVRVPATLNIVHCRR